MSEIDRALPVVRAQAGHRSSLVALEQVQNSGSTSVAAGGVNVALFAADDKVVDIAGREGQGCHSNGTTLLVLELEGLLRLRQHVEAPGAKTTVGGDADEVELLLNLPGIDINYGDGGSKGKKAAAWLEKNGYKYGQCRRYENEWWHFEPVIAPGGTCPVLLADATLTSQLQPTPEK